MNKKIISILMSTLLILNTFIIQGLPSFSEVISWNLSGNTGWTSAYPSNNQNDYLQDQQTGSGTVSQDIVGDASFPSTYVHFNEDTLAFRIRVNDIDGGSNSSTYHFKNFAFIGVDADINGSIDFFIGAYNPSGSNGRIGIYGSNPGYLNISPSTTGISGKPVMAYKPVRFSNYAITMAEGSQFNGNADYFISFSVPVADIANAVSGLGLTFGKSTPFRFMTGTAAQDNSFNQDLNGMDKSGWSSGGTWNSLGVFSGVVSADGTAVVRTVTFDKNTGDIEATPSIKAISSGAAVGTLPLAPTKRGMYFQEWNTSPDGSGSKLTTSTIISADTTYYAIWSDKQVYTVTFSPNGGTLYGTANSVVIPTINGVIGDNMPENPIRTNNYFMGWNTLASPTGGSPGVWFNSASTVTANTTVYAQWNNNSTKEAVFYDNFTPDGGSVIATIYSNGNSNNFNGALPTISRQGYAFGGWYLNDKTGTGTPVASIGSQGDYYAKWTAASYTISFNPNAGSDSVTGIPVNRLITDGFFGTLPEKPIRAGYEFIEWNRNASGTGEAMYATTPVSSNFQVYAIWRSSKTVSFMANGGQLDGAADSNQYILSVDNKLSFMPQPLSRENYTFLGWGLQADATSAIDPLSLGNYETLYAVWKPIYFVTFNTNLGNFADSSTELSIETAYGGVLYLPEQPTRAGYTFGGWRTAPEGGEGFGLATNVDQNMTVYATWIPIVGALPTVTFQTNGGSALSSLTGNQIASQPLSTLMGYVLEGWYSSPDLNPEDIIQYPFDVQADMTLYAKWSPVTFMATYDANQGLYDDESTSIEITQNYGTKFILPSVLPNNPGFTFASWNTAADGSGAAVTSETIVIETQSITLYAVWTEFGNITFQYGANSATYGSVSLQSESINPESGTPTGAVAIPNQGYVFVEWVDSNGISVGTDPHLIPEKAESLYESNQYVAVFAPDTSLDYQVLLDDNGGQGGNGVITTRYGESMPAATKPVREGYVFEGYFDDISAGNAYYSINMDSLKTWDKTVQNLTLYARWRAHDIQGTIVDDAIPAAQLVGATVKVMRGNVQYGATTMTDVDGAFLIQNIPSGTYNLIITLGDKTQIVAVTVLSNQTVTHVGTIIFPLGNASSALKLIGAGTPPIVIGNLHPEAERYFNDVDPSSFVKVEMVVQRTDLATAQANSDVPTVTAINSIDTRSRQRNAVLGMYLDLTVERHYRELEVNPWNFIGNVSRTNSLIEIIIPIPESLQGKSSYVVYRYHDDEVNEITNVPNADGEYLIFDASNETLKLYVRNFSIYALGYFEPVSNPIVTPDNDDVIVVQAPVEPILAKPIELDKISRFAYISGYPDQTFRPERHMTRAEATAMFARLMLQKAPSDVIYPSSFTDVNPKDWYAQAIGYMNHLGVVSGYSDGTFRPNAPITRAEFAVLASRFDALSTGVPNPFSDVSDKHWASAFIASASVKGWINGYPDGTFKPNLPIKRSEVVALVNSMLSRKFDKALLVAYPQLYRMYSDLLEAHWAFHDILEASMTDNF